MNKMKLLVLWLYFLSINVFSLENINIPEMVFVQGGKFIMGDNSIILRDKGFVSPIPHDKYTEHEVILSDFYMGKYEVTVKEFLEFIKETGFITLAQKDSEEGDKYWERCDGKWNYPIANVTHVGAVEYCKWLTKKTGETYRLPTEAEWEYAATGGKRQKYPWGNEYIRLDTDTYWDQVHYIKSEKLIHPVGTFPKDISPFGICNMFGNVAEWVLDAWDPLFYENSSIVNPLNANVNKKTPAYIFRGISDGYVSDENQYGVRERFGRAETLYSKEIGFRVVREIGKEMFNQPYALGEENYSAFGRVNDYWLRIREQPTLTGNFLGYLNKDDKVTIVKRTLGEIEIEGMKAYWYKVHTLKGITGWVYGYYVDILAEQK